MVERLGAQATFSHSTYIRVKYQGALPNLPQVSKYSKKALVLPDLKSASLIYLGQLYDDECQILLHKIILYIIKNKMMLQGHRNNKDGL